MASLLCNAYGYKVKLINGGYAGLIGAKFPMVINGMRVEIVNGQTQVTENYEPTEQRVQQPSTSTPQAVVSQKSQNPAGLLLKARTRPLELIAIHADFIEAQARAKGDTKALLAIRTLKRLASEFERIPDDLPIEERLLRTTQVLTGMSESLGGAQGTAQSDLGSTLRHTGSITLEALTPLLTKGRSAKSISNLQVKVALESDPNFTLVDVRERNEFNLHYDGAVNLPLQAFLMQAQQGKLTFDKNKPLALICASGGRAGQAAAAALMAGFKDVYNILGGVNAGFGCGVPLVFNNTKLPNPRADVYPPEVRALPLAYAGGNRYR
jgi:rhodanese-related sulfurtransferase